MAPALYLHFTGVFLSYSLRVGVAYMACCFLARLLHKPQQRFLLWMVFLLGAGTYWLGMIWVELREASPSPSATVGNSAGSVPVLSHSFQVPLAWGGGVLLAGEILGLAYLLAVVLLLCAAAWRHIALRLLLRRALEPSRPLARLFQETCRDFRVSRSRLLVLPGLRSPATAYWWNPRILLPEVCEGLGPTPQLADALYHELVHVARRDYLWSTLSDLICRILFFHPAAWQARKRLQLQSELACDLAVVEARPGHRADYADSLAYFVRLGMLHESASAGVEFAAPVSSLSTRIRAILATPQPISWWKAAARATAGLALVAAFGVLSPALDVDLDFQNPDPVQAAPEAQSTAPAARTRNMRRAARAHAPQQPQSTDVRDRDSLTGLRVQPRVAETPAYSLTAGTGSRPDSEPDELDNRGWSEPNPAPRSVSSVVFSTVNQILVGRIPHGRDHDHDGH